MSKLSIPIAIIIAGAFIAGAVLFSGSGSSGGGNNNLATRTAPIEMRGVRADEHLRGSAEAAVVMVEFSDTECPFCQQFDGTMRQVMESYSSDDVAWAYRHFPLAQLHPKAPKEAESLECAAEQGGNEMFWLYSDLVYSTTNANNSLDIGVYNTPSPTPTDADGTPYYAEKTPRSETDAGQLSDIAVELGLDQATFEECLSSDRFASVVQTDLDEAGGSGGNGTPYVVFVSKDKISKGTKAVLDAFIPTVGADTFVISNDGYRISMSGALPFSMVEEILDSILE